LTFRATLVLTASIREGLGFGLRGFTTIIGLASSLSADFITVTISIVSTARLVSLSAALAVVANLASVTVTIGATLRFTSTSGTTPRTTSTRSPPGIVFISTDSTLTDKTIAAAIVVPTAISSTSWSTLEPVTQLSSKTIKGSPAEVFRNTLAALSVATGALLAVKV
jgi:hypothetical protein